MSFCASIGSKVNVSPFTLNQKRYIFHKVTNNNHENITLNV
ncbi:hypothetical protein ALT1000_180046 [Alteromonas macleodii]